MSATATSNATCPCYGCSVDRQRSGIPSPDRSADSCEPAGACSRDGCCWTHSEWVDETAYDPRTPVREERRS